MTRPHETGERDDNPNADASYEFTAADYDRTKDAYLEAITTQHDGGTTPLANRWVKFFQCVRHAFPFLVKAISDSKQAIDILEDKVTALEREKQEIVNKYERQVEQLFSDMDLAESYADRLTSIILGEPIDWTFHEAKWNEAIKKLQEQSNAN